MSGVDLEFAIHHDRDLDWGGCRPIRGIRQRILKFQGIDEEDVLSLVLLLPIHAVVVIAFHSEDETSPLQLLDERYEQRPIQSVFVELRGMPIAG